MSVEPEQSQTTGGGAIPVDSFGNRLMLARAHAGHISIREAADLCDIGRGAWTNWEKGARPVDILDVAAVVADKLGVDRNWLLFGGGLAEADPRTLRRTIERTGPGGLKKNLAAPHLPHRNDHVRTGHGSPMATQRRDSVRPVSAVPASQRRPVSVRPHNRPIAS